MTVGWLLWSWTVLGSVVEEAGGINSNIIGVVAHLVNLISSNNIFNILLINNNLRCETTRVHASLVVGLVIFHVSVQVHILRSLLVGAMEMAMGKGEVVAVVRETEMERPRRGEAAPVEWPH